MPLQVFSAAEAFRRVHQKRSRWPRSAETQAERLMPLAQPEFTPTFRINKDDLIFTVGSCFARNIEKQLIVEGYNVAASRFSPPEDLGFKADPDALLNRYVVTSIANELRWALGHGKPFRDHYFVKVGQDWFDPHLHPAIRPSPPDVVKRRREAVREYMALAGQASVFVMTLGLAEAWYDRKTSLYLNGVLPARARDAHPGRFELHILDYNQILEQLNFIRELLKAYGRPDVKMLVTVSPVAMNTTFSGGEVLVANTYSKAVQRAAVEAFVVAHEDVDYFPSYESVTLSDRRRAWRPDQAHASDEIVRLNVLRMIEAYSRDEPAEPAIRSAAEAFHLVQLGKEAVGAGDPEKAMTAFRTAAEIAPHEALILLEYGRFLLDVGEFDDARKWLKASVRRGSASYGGYYSLAQAYRALGRLDEAHVAAGRGRKHQPNRPGLLALSADVARRLGRLDEALQFAATCVELEPEAEPFRKLLEDIRRAMTAASSEPALAAEPVLAVEAAAPDAA